MRGDELVKNQLLLAQAISTLAHHLDMSSGFQLTAIPVAQLPNPPTPGMIGCVNDALSPAIGSAVAGGGTVTVLVWYAGAAWKVLAL